jgi:mannose-1-phosphate guanylyltransferase
VHNTPIREQRLTRKWGGIYGGLSQRTGDTKSWAVILAGGDGTRLAALTRDAHGAHVPKQFCALVRGQALLGDALARAARITSRERVCVVVAEQHRHYWESSLGSLVPANVVVEPRNCGTALGILHAVTHIVNQNPDAHIVVLPADHYFNDEPRFSRHLLRAVSLLRGDRSKVVIVGVEPAEAACDLGYIVPGPAQQDGGHAVARFVEKPKPDAVRKLLAAGAVCNTLILAAEGEVLLRLLCERMSGIASSMWTALARRVQHERGSTALQGIYAGLPAVDFSQTVLQGNEARLRLLTVPSCGWSDLGTPARLLRAVAAMDDVPDSTRQRRRVNVPGVLSLATRCQAFQMGR